MVANYRCFTVTANADENVVDKIYSLLKEEGYTNEPHIIEFTVLISKYGSVFITGNYNPEIILNVGLAGAHSADIHTGDIVIGEKCLNTGSYKTLKK